MGATTDPNDPNLWITRPDGQHESYLVLSEEERAKGFVCPVRTSYRHVKCGGVTRMGPALCETYARNPKFYGATFCCVCRDHYPLQTADGPQFLWEPDGVPVGSGPEAFQKAQASPKRDWAAAIAAGGQNQSTKGQQIAFGDLRRANVPRVPFFGHSIDDWTETDWACAAAGEVGELCNGIKKRRRDPAFSTKIGKPPPSDQEIADEAADVVIYLDLLLARMGQDLGEAVRRKFNEVSVRTGAPQRIGGQEGVA